MLEDNPYRAPSNSIGSGAPGRIRSRFGIYGTDHLSDEDLVREIEAGGRFVVFDYCVSALVVTFHRTGKRVYFIRPGGIAAFASSRYTLLSLVAGWWGFPWGFIFTPAAIIRNLCGGKDVTSDVLRYLGWSRA